MGRTQKKEGSSIGYVVCQATGKRGYMSRSDAKTIAKRINANLSQFVCQHCDYWHNGTLPRVVVRGSQARNSEMQAKRPTKDG